MTGPPFVQDRSLNQKSYIFPARPLVQQPDSSLVSVLDLETKSFGHPARDPYGPRSRYPGYPLHG